MFFQKNRLKMRKIIKIKIINNNNNRSIIRNLQCIKIYHLNLDKNNLIRNSKIYRMNNFTILIKKIYLIEYYFRKRRVEFIKKFKNKLKKKYRKKREEYKI